MRYLLLVLGLVFSPFGSSDIVYLGVVYPCDEAPHQLDTYRTGCSAVGVSYAAYSFVNAGSAEYYYCPESKATKYICTFYDSDPCVDDGGVWSSSSGACEQPDPCLTNFGDACPNKNPSDACQHTADYANNPSCPAPNTGAGSCSEPAAGNPILISSGNKFESVVDYSNQATLPLVIARAYNSQLHGWRFSHQIKLAIDDSVIVWVDAQGRGLSFSLIDGRWQLPSQPSVRLNQEVGGGWLLDDGARHYRFNTAGRLESLGDRTGNTLHYQYANEALASVTNQQGDSLRYQFNVNKRVETITVGTDLVYRYAYDTNANLITVTHPDDTVTTYHYEDTRFPNALTGITDPRGIRYATWAYDDQGRAISSEHAGGAGKVTLAFDDAAFATMLTNALGKQTTYQFETIQGHHKVVAVSGHASANCAAANQAYTYTDNGLLATKTDWQGVVTRYEYNERGLETRRISAEATPAQQIVSTDWHATSNKPTRITTPTGVTVYSYDDKGLLLKAER